MRNRIIATAVVVLFGVIAANFLWQLVDKHLWNVAIERSFFQFFAIVAMTISLLRLE